MLTSRTFAVNHTPPRRRTPETTLYAPVKPYLEALGFTVKGEVCGSDLVALHGEEPPIVVIGELKLAFSDARPAKFRSHGRFERRRKG